MDAVRPKVVRKLIVHLSCETSWEKNMVTLEEVPRSRVWSKVRGLQGVLESLFGDRRAGFAISKRFKRSH